jgi:hypothetical protein
MDINSFKLTNKNGSYFILGSVFFKIDRTLKEVTQTFSLKLFQGVEFTYLNLEGTETFYIKKGIMGFEVTIYDYENCYCLEIIQMHSEPDSIEIRIDVHLRKFLAECFRENEIIFLE